MARSKVTKKAPAKSRKPAAATTTATKAAAQTVFRPVSAKRTHEKPKATAMATPTPATPTGAHPKLEAKPKEDLVVFAIRLTEPERDAIHAAAGPAGATRFIRAVAIAASHGDVDAFKRALKDAEEARAKAAAKK